MKISKKDDDFLYACQQGDFETLEKLLQAGMAVDGVEGAPSYARPLASALLCHQWEVAHWLLDRGADVATGMREMDDPIEHLSQDKEGRIGQLVNRMLDDLEGRDDLDFEKLLGKSFYKACEFGALAVAQRIFRLWKDPSQVEFRHSPVGWAAINGHHQTVAWLCENGYDHQYHRDEELPPAVYAILGCSAKSLRVLLQQGESSNRTAPAHAFRMIRVDHLNQLPVNDCHEIFQQGTLLHFAAISGDVECVEVLLAAGADPARRDSEGRTAAVLAKLGGPATKAVADRLSDVSEDEPPEANVAFRQGVVQNEVETVRDALSRGADGGQPIRSDFGNESRAMTIAARRGDVALLEALVGSGIDLEQLDCDAKQTATRDTASFVIEEIGLDYLKTLTALGRTPFLCAAQGGQIEALEWLDERGADRDVRDNYGMNALHVAALSNQPETIDWLIHHGFGIEDLAIEKLTPLHIAAAANSRHAVLKLLELGADPTARNANRETPYDMAKDSGKPATYRALEDVTPQEVRKRRRKTKKPAWTYDQAKQENYLSAAQQKFGKDASRLASAKFARRLKLRSESETLQGVIAKLGKHFDCEPKQHWEDLPYVYQFSVPKLTVGTLLKLQERFQREQIFLVRRLRSSEQVDLHAIAGNDPFEAMAALRLAGDSFGLSTKQLIGWLMSLADRHPFRLLALDPNGVQIRLNQSPSDARTLLDELMMICPPEDFEERVYKSLQKQLRNKRPKLEFWWG